MATRPEDRLELDEDEREVDEYQRLLDDEREAPDGRSLADELIDDLLPPEFDWRRVVRRYPIPALLVAATGGYLLGRSKGPAIVEAVAELATAEITGRVGALAGEDLS